MERLVAPPNRRHGPRTRPADVASFAIGMKAVNQGLRLGPGVPARGREEGQRGFVVASQAA
jgi:hypothetical protein